MKNTLQENCITIQNQTSIGNNYNTQEEDYILMSKKEILQLCNKKPKELTLEEQHEDIIKNLKHRKEIKKVLSNIEKEVSKFYGL